MPTYDERATKSSVFASGTYDTGGGQDDHLPVAESYQGLVMRGAIDFPKVDWAGVTGLTSATLYLTSTAQVHVARGSSPGCTLRRITAAWTPNGASDDGSGSWTTEPDTYPGPSTTTSGEVQFTGRDASNVTDSIDVSAIVLAWAPSSVVGPGGKHGSGATQRGIALRERSGSSRQGEWYSAEHPTSSQRPRLVVVTTTAVVPKAPSLVAPLGPEADARTMRFTIAGAAPVSWDIDVSLEADMSPTIWAPRAQTTDIVAQGTGWAVATPYLGPALIPGTTYHWRARATGAQGAGPWSAAASFTPHPNPGARDPYEEWASAILGAQAAPRLALRPGGVHPHDEQVAPLVTADLGTPVVVALTNPDHPHGLLTSEGILVGMRVSVDHAGGWQVDPVIGAAPPSSSSRGTVLG